MELIITQTDDNCRDYFDLFAKFLDTKGIQNKEQLESRFNILACEFAMMHNGKYVRDETRMIF